MILSLQHITIIANALLNLFPQRYCYYYYYYYYYYYVVTTTTTGICR